MKKITLVLLMLAVFLTTSCASTNYANYYPSGQVREEYSDNRIGVLDIGIAAVVIPFLFICALAAPGPHGHHHFRH